MADFGTDFAKSQDRLSRIERGEGPSPSPPRRSLRPSSTYRRLPDRDAADAGGLDAALRELMPYGDKLNAIARRVVLDGFAAIVRGVAARAGLAARPGRVATRGPTARARAWT